MNLGYTDIVAPASGIIGRRSIEIGQRIAPGQLLLNIVPVDDIWVTANYKETQLRHVRPGAHVTFHVDAYGNIPSQNLDRHFSFRVLRVSKCPRHKNYLFEFIQLADSY